MCKFRFLNTFSSGDKFVQKYLRTETQWLCIKVYPKIGSYTHDNIMQFLNLPWTVFFEKISIKVSLCVTILIEFSW